MRINKNVTVVIPAYNEEKNIADTVKSILRQTIVPAKVIVVDDYSTDDTGGVARSLGVKVVRTPRNTGSKAGAINFGLTKVKTKYTLIIDADTLLEKNAIEKMLPTMKDKSVAAASGFVVPQNIKTIWERGRYIEYLLAFTFNKPIQSYYQKPLISSGCFSLFRTEILKKYGGLPQRTVTEDLDFTWLLYEKGHKVRFIPEAICYPIDPHNFTYMKRQLRRWTRGFMQNVRLHWKGVMRVPYLQLMIPTTIIDATLGSILFLFLPLTLSLLYQNPLFLLGYLIDAPAVFIPAIYKGVQRKEVLLTLTSFPAFFLLRFVNSVFALEAAWSELVMNRQYRAFQKGHQ